MDEVNIVSQSSFCQIDTQPLDSIQQFYKEGLALVNTGGVERRHRSSELVALPPRNIKIQDFLLFQMVLDSKTSNCNLNESPNELTLLF